MGNSKTVLHSLKIHCFQDTQNSDIKHLDKMLI